jgi:flagellar hook-length control protein FliK
MSPLTAFSASSLTAETARMDRQAGERRDESSAPGAVGFAGLLRAAGVQPAGQPGAGEGARSSQSRAPGLNAPPKTATAASTGAPPAAPLRSPDATAQAKSAEARAQAERPRTSSTGAKGSEGEAVSAEEAGPDQTEAAQPAASGSATLAHWMMQLAAQRHGGIGLPQAGRGAGDAAGAGASTAGDAAAAGGAAAKPTSLNLPGWARPDAGAGAGVWAGGGGQAVCAQSAQPLEADSARATLGAEFQESGAGGFAADALNGFASQLAALAAGAPPPDAAAAVNAVPGEAFVQTPVGSPGFGDEVMVKVAAFSLDGVQEAQLHLNPAELGPIQVRIALDGTQARIDFGAATDSTRALLEQALPALAEALQADGLQLAASSVASEVSEADPQADFSGAGSGRGQAGDGQADAGGGRPGGWGQQSEASAARSARAPGEPMRPGQRADGVLGWAGERPSGTASGGRGLDLYA